MTQIYPPQMERALLSCLLIDHDGVVLAECKRTFGQANPFYDMLTHHCYDQILTTGDTDLWVLSEKLTPILREHGDILLLLQEVYQEVPTSANYDKYLRVVLDCWRRRSALAILSNAESILTQKGTDTRQCLVTSSEALKTLSMDKAKKRMSAQEQWESEESRINSDGELLTLGYPEWDDLLGYREPGDHVVIGARPGVGKTMVMNNLMRRLGKQGYPIGCISLELTEVANMSRMVGAEARVDTKEVMWAINADKVRAAKELMFSLPIYWEDNASTTIQEIENLSDQWVRNHNIRYLFIDYLQRVKGGRGDSERLRVKDVCERITAIAKNTGLVVVSLAQLGRPDDNTPPSIKDFKETGKIEEDAHLAGLILRQPPTEEDNYRIRKGESLPVKIHWCKNRRGPEAWSSMNCYFKYCELVGRITHEDVEVLR